MHRHLARGLAAAALTSAALVALPQAAFANQTDPGGGSSPATVLHVRATDGAATATTASRATAPARTARPTTSASASTASSTAKAKSSTSTSAAKASTSKTSPAKTSPANSTAATGSDISYPQCSVTPPTNQHFGVVGVNGGNAALFNRCLPQEFDWASKTLGDHYQDKVSLYINTANPGDLGSWWPASNTDRPAIDPNTTGPTTPLSTDPVTYPDTTVVPCSATADPYGPACAYVYGYVRAMQAIQYAKDALGTRYSGTLRWWLDTETSNTWAGPFAANAASLAGAETALARASSDGIARVGVYSTTSQYRAIVGGVGAAVPALPDGETSPLIHLPEWGAGAPSLKGAQSNCSVATFTGGTMNLTQYISGAFDYDVSCAAY